MVRPSILSLALLAPATDVAHAPPVRPNGGDDAMRGAARLLSTGDAQTSAPLQAARPGMLIGKAARSLRSAPSGEVDLTTPAGATVRAVFG